MALILIASSPQYKLDWAYLYDIERLEAFVSHLQRVGIGPDGISQKLDRLLDAVNYRLTRCTSADSTHFGIQKAIHCLGQWQKSLRKKRAMKRRARLELLSEARLTAGEVDEAVEHKDMWSHYRYCPAHPRWQGRRDPPPVCLSRPPRASRVQRLGPSLR